jgi:hypothetical protein
MPPEPLALPGEPAPELLLDPPLLELPELPLDPLALELLAPELPLLELEPLAPPPLGDEAPELEEGVGGVGTEGVVGVLAEGQPANISKTPTKPIASSGRSLIGNR